MRLPAIDHGPDPQPPSCMRDGAARRLRTLFAAALTIAVGTLFVAAPTAATLYKWVDKNGRVIYSDQPPPSDVKVEIVKPPPPPANPNAAQELADKELDIKLRDKKRADEAKVAEKTRVDSDKRRENCVQARGQLQALQAADQQYYRFNEKGERVYLDDEGRRAAIEQNARAVRDNCQN